MGVNILLHFFFSLVKYEERNVSIIFFSFKKIQVRMLRIIQSRRLT